MEECPSINSLAACLVDSACPIARRMRAVFWLKHKGGDTAIDTLNGGFASESVLLKHEIAYVMGQMGNPHAIPYLTRILGDESRNCIVRHEAAEALGAIGKEESLDVLKKFVNDSSLEVAQTCQLAIDTIKWKKANKIWNPSTSSFNSMDPAPPATSFASVSDLRARLLDKSLSLFERYRAMFALREDGSDEAIEALTEGLNDDGALFRHEIAYVLGQLMNSAATDKLTEALRNQDEHPMVRHEAAEALGAIAEDKAIPLLKEFQSHSEKVISESCDVALDLADYWSKGGEKKK
eukprot:821280_1